MSDSTSLKHLASSLLLPELERQLKEDPSLWPNIKGLFVITVAKKKKPMATWYLVMQGKDTMPLITENEEDAKNAVKGKLRTVKIQVEDSNLVNFITGGMTGVKAYMTGKIKVRGDLMLAQRLEEVFEMAGGRKV
ncbi:SCP2 sterol-binding domain-containing protein [Dichotomocladium elegans]|nr:SCP2 sterol-binding domain-containing protein [Dichotomocladium elegans]